MLSFITLYIRPELKKANNSIVHWPFYYRLITIFRRKKLYVF